MYPRFRGSLMNFGNSKLNFSQGISWYELSLSGYNRLVTRTCLCKVLDKSEIRM